MILQYSTIIYVKSIKREAIILAHSHGLKFSWDVFESPNRVNLWNRLGPWVHGSSLVTNVLGPAENNIGVQLAHSWMVFAYLCQRDSYKKGTIRIIKACPKKNTTYRICVNAEAKNHQIKRPKLYLQQFSQITSSAHSSQMFQTFNHSESHESTLISIQINSAHSSDIPDPSISQMFIDFP